MFDQRCSVAGAGGAGGRRILGRPMAVDHLMQGHRKSTPKFIFNGLSMRRVITTSIV